MILSERYKLIFMHNPKSGGTSVRALLRPFHDGNPIFVSRGKQPHPILGQVIYGHLTLKEIQDHFPFEYSKFEEYESYALIRAPKDRFVSSLSQFMREMKGLDTHKFELNKYIEASQEVCSYLKCNDHIKDRNFIHFEKQINYIFLNDKKVIRHVWTVDRIDELFHDVQARTGCALDVENGQRHNKTITYRSKPAEYLYKGLRSAANTLPRSIIPDEARRFVRTMVFNNRLKSKIWPALPENSRQFILDYYSQDLEYYRSLHQEQGVRGEVE